MARIRIYTNSVLANIVNILGYLFVFTGVAGLFEGVILGGILMIGVGLALMFWASNISENKKFTNWKKSVQAKGLEPKIRSSNQVAVQVYNAYPCDKTLKYIQTLNPAAAQMIASQIAANNAGKK